MKKYIYLFLLTFVIVSCSEQIEDNRSALQARINGDLYSAIDLKAVLGVDGDITISGLTSSDNLTITLSSSSVGTYLLGGENPNFATFTGSNNFTYNTNPKGEGQVTITRIDHINQTIYGSFDFVAEIDNLSAINVQYGLFFEVPYTNELEEVIPAPVSLGCESGNFGANIDDDHLLLQGPNLCVTSEIVGDQIVVTATDPNEEIQVKIPLTAVVGQSLLPAEGFTATYTDLVTMITEEAVSGRFIVLTHDTVINKLKVSFTFTTQNHVIDGGSMNVTYQ